MNRRDSLSWLAGGAMLAAAGLRAGQARAAADTRFTQARSFLQDMVADEQFNGAVLMIHQEGRPAFDHAVGWLDAAHATPMPRDAICQMASMTKPVTGVCTLILIEQGKLKLDDPIDRWLPEMADRKVLRRPDGPLTDIYPSPRPITVRDLLSFRCGYGGDGPRGPFGEALRMASTNNVRAVTPESFLKALNPIPLQYAPGETWLYDVPADLLSVLIARVSGESYGAFAKAHVFDPLGMKDTGFYVPPAKAGRVAQLPTGAGGQPPVTAPPSFESGGHGLYSTGPDYMRFARMLLGQGEFAGARILKPESVRGMAIDTLTPAEHVSGGFISRYPGRGYGQTMAVRTDPVKWGPSVGAFNWAGATGVWFMVDPARKMVIVAMVQHPGLGPAPDATGRNTAKPRKRYATQTAWNDAIQMAVYQDLDA